MESWLSDGESLRVEAERSRAEARELQESARQTRARAEVQVERARRLAAEMITIHLASSLVAADLALQLGEHVYLIERPEGTDARITHPDGDTLRRICDWARRNRLATVEVTVNGETRTLAA